MSYICKDYSVIEVVTTTGNKTINICLSYVEQSTLNEMFAISSVDAFKIGFAFAMVIIVSAIFNQLSKIGNRHE